MIGCITLVKVGCDIVGIRCAKGRGVILPGGKWERGETFVECAKRELFEETGLIGVNFKLVFSGESEEGFFTYAFTADVEKYLPTSSGEGTVMLTTWDELKRSKFAGFYELMEMACSVAK